MIEEITISGTNYTYDQYDSVYREHDDAWWFCGKLNGRSFENAAYDLHEIWLNS